MPRDPRRSTPGLTQSRAHVVTDNTGHILQMDVQAAHLLNMSQRGARGRSFLPFIGERREEFASDMGRVPSVGLPARETVLRPRERRPVSLAIELRQHPDGVEWVIAFPTLEGITAAPEVGGHARSQPA